MNNVNGGAGGAPITPREGAMFFTYYTYKYHSSLDYYTELLTYFIIGGSDGTKVLNDIYTTTDLGGFWTKAEDGSSLSLPKDIKGRAFASAVVCEESLDIRSSQMSWNLLESPVIPTGMRRYTKALTTEPVPFIYMFGGVDEIHLWKKLEELNQIYETSLSAERARYDALIADHQKSCDAMIRKYKELAERGTTGQDTNV